MDYKKDRYEELAFNDVPDHLYLVGDKLKLVPGSLNFELSQEFPSSREHASSEGRNHQPHVLLQVRQGKYYHPSISSEKF